MHAQVQRLVSVVQMATVLGVCPTEEQHSAACFLWAKGLKTKKCILFMAGSVCHVKWFTTESRNSLKDEEVETEVWQWLGQQSKDFHAVGFDTLVKQWEKCINVGGGSIEKYVFLRFKYHMFYVLCPFMTYLLTLPHTFLTI
jgi:hypothetical protein